MTKAGKTSDPGPCVVCGGEGRAHFTAHGYVIARCGVCGHLYSSPDPGGDHVARVYGDDYFFAGGAGYVDYTGEADLLRERGARYARLLRRHVPPGSILDVGAAAGFVLEGFLADGWTGRGIEPNARMSAIANERLGPLVAIGSFESFDPTQRFDVVSMIQVIGHFLDPRRALAHAAALTRPGGFWLIETWDRASLTARVFGRHWHEFSPPSVLHWFSRVGLRRLAESLGFEEVAWGRPKRWITLDHARSLLEHKLGGSALRHCLLLLRLLSPSLRLPYPGDDLFWVLFHDVRHRGPKSAGYPGPSIHGRAGSRS